MRPLVELVGDHRSHREGQQRAVCASESGAPVAGGARNATAASSGAMARQLLPAISARPCRVIASGSRWCSRKGSDEHPPDERRVLLEEGVAEPVDEPEKKSAASSRARPHREPPEAERGGLRADQTGGEDDARGRTPPSLAAHSTGASQPGRSTVTGDALESSGSRDIEQILPGHGVLATDPCHGRHPAPRPDHSPHVPDKGASREARHRAHWHQPCSFPWSAGPARRTSVPERER